MDCEHSGIADFEGSSRLHANVTRSRIQGASARAERVEEIAQFGGEDVKYTPRCQCHTDCNYNGGQQQRRYAGTPHTQTHRGIHGHIRHTELKPQIRTLRSAGSGGEV